MRSQEAMATMAEKLNSKQEAIQIIGRALQEAINRIDWVENVSLQLPSWRWERPVPPQNPIEYETLYTTLEREDGHRKRKGFCVIYWWGTTTRIAMAAPEERISKVQLTVNLANPDWESVFQTNLKILRQRACENQGRGGGKKYKRNRLKWR
jgi:hypothetical protein